MPVDPIPVDMLLAVIAVLVAVCRQSRRRRSRFVRALVTSGGVRFVVEIAGIEASPPDRSARVFEARASCARRPAPVRTAPRGASPVGVGEPARRAVLGYSVSHAATGHGERQPARSRLPEREGRHHWRCREAPDVPASRTGWETVLSGVLPLPPLSNGRAS